MSTESGVRSWSSFNRVRSQGVGSQHVIDQRGRSRISAVKRWSLILAVRAAARNLSAALRAV
jgi:hypothetical protein